MAGLPKVLWAHDIHAKLARASDYAASIVGTQAAIENEIDEEAMLALQTLRPPAPTSTCRALNPYEVPIPSCQCGALRKALRWVKAQVLDEV